MLDIKVEIPRTQQLRIARLLSPNRMRFAEKEALNQTGRFVAKMAQRQVAKYMGISASKLAKRGRKVSYSSSSSRQYGRVSKGRNATFTRLYTTIGFAGRPFNINRFGGRVIKDDKGRGIGATHKAWGKSQSATGPIWQAKTLAGKPIMVAQPGKYRSGRSRFRSVYGPGVAQVAEQPRIVRAMQRAASLKFRSAFANRVAYAYSNASHVRV